MPVSSHMVGGLIGGQQAMFGNFASYSQQISPYGGGGPMPTYSNPMAGMGEAMMPPPAPHLVGHRMAEDYGTRAVGMMGHLPSAIGTMGLVGGIGGMMGSRAMGMMGSAAGVFDPFSAAIGGFGRGMGWMRGAGIGANLGRLGSMGIGGIARAGMAGLGGAAIAAAPVYALTKGVEYAAGQMVQGAQYQGQVGQTLQQNFRFLNPAGTGGYGFGRQEQHGISDMMREMGHKEMMSTPGEMLRVLQQGAGMGMFKAVADARQFKQKFQEMVGTLKEVAKTMNTSLEGAMPFLAQARQQGFWTPTDIMKNATMARGAAAATGMSVAQVQGMMGAGAQMARSIGAEGRRGAIGMGRAINVAGALVGGPGREGILSEEETGELTGGLQGAEAAQSIAGQWQAATTRFARGRYGRWLLAGLGTNKYGRLDTSKLADLRAGRIGVGAVGSMARSGIARGGAANFVMNEERLRGQLVEQGPEAMLGAMQGLIGSRLYSEQPMDQYVTRRLLKRYGFASSSREADMMARAARELPQKMRELRQRSALDTDQQERQREEQLNRSWDGVKRQLGKWWDNAVKEPLQKVGAEVAANVSEYFEEVSDKLFGRVAQRHRFRGMSSAGVRALEAASFGDRRQMERTFGKAAQTKQLIGEAAMSGFTRERAGYWADAAKGEQRNARVFAGDEGRERLESIAWGGASVREAVSKSGQKLSVGDLATLVAEKQRKSAAGYRAAMSGEMTPEAVRALGFSSPEEARKQVAGAREAMSGTEFQTGAMKIAQRTEAQGPGALSKAVFGDSSKTDSAEAQVRAIEEGEIGTKSLRQYLRGARTMEEKKQRLQLAQRGSVAEKLGFAAVDLSDEAKKAAKDAGEQYLGSEKAVAEAWEKSEKQLAAAATFTGWAEGTLGKKDVIDPKFAARVMQRGGDKIKEAMRTISDEKATDEEKSKARDYINSLAKGKEVPPEERAILLAMTDPKNKIMSKVVKTAAGVSQSEERLKTGEALKRRSDRFISSLGDQAEMTLEAMDTVKGANSSQSVGSVVRSLVGETDPDQYQSKIEELTRLSSQIDPKKAQILAEKLRGVPGGEAIEAAIHGGMEAKQLATDLTGKSKGKQTAAAAKFMQGLTGKLLGGTAFKDIMAGGEKGGEAEKAYLESVDPRLRGIAKEGLEALKSPEGRMNKIMELGIRSAQAQAHGALGDPKKDQLELIRDNVKKAQAGEVFGRLGSKEAMHQVAAQTNTLLRELIDVAKEGKGITGNKKDPPPNP